MPLMMNEQCKGCMYQLQNRREEPNQPTGTRPNLACTSITSDHANSLWKVGVEPYPKWIKPPNSGVALEGSNLLEESNQVEYVAGKSQTHDQSGRP